MTFCAQLTDRALLRISGKDCLDFLHTLVTCDVRALGEGQTTYGALLTPQGKILFDFHLKREASGFLLDCHKDARADLLTRFSFYKLRAEVSLEEDDSDIFVSWSANPEEEKPEKTMQADSRLGLLGARSYGRAQTDASQKPNASQEQWHRHRLALGVPEWGLDYVSNELFPHDAMMDQFERGGIDFEKGCYVGQEVVSRMEHRATARRRFAVISAKNLVPSFPPMGTELKSGDKKIGVMGSHMDETGLALLHLERAGAVRDRSGRMETNYGILEARPPSYANFGWRDDS